MDLPDEMNYGAATASNKLNISQLPSNSAPNSKLPSSRQITMHDSSPDT